MGMRLYALLDCHRLNIRFNGFQYLRDESRSCSDISRDNGGRPRNDIETVFNQGRVLINSGSMFVFSLDEGSKESHMATRSQRHLPEHRSHLPLQLMHSGNY